MFVRFRKLLREQGGIHYEYGRYLYRVGRKFRVAGLPPYRLNVSLVESVRDNGKVRQVHIAGLGSLSGHLLPEFFEGLPQSRAAEVLENPHWIADSALERGAFWKEANETLASLRDRLGDNEPRIRADLLARVPLLTRVEVERVDCDIRNPNMYVPVYQQYWRERRPHVVA